LRSQAVGNLASALAPWTSGGLMTVIVTGPLLFGADLTRYMNNPAFVLKMGLLAVALAAHFTLHRSAVRFDHASEPGRQKLARFRRIPRAELLRFMKTNEIPTDILESGKKRILVVDDDNQIIELFVDVLSRDDRFEVKTASTGYDAGLATEGFRPHLILLDYMLPDINGNLVCERIRANADLKDTKIIIVSGVVNQEEIDALTRSGCDGFVKKPFNIEKLVERMAELLEV
jgi:CheY-like chemotaxis protein